MIELWHIPFGVGGYRRVRGIRWRATPVRRRETLQRGCISEENLLEPRPARPGKEGGEEPSDGREAL